MSPAKRVLLIDDDPALREMLSEQLQRHNEFVAVTAATGAEGLWLARTDRFDAIVLDVGLPDADGREVCRRMRRDGVKAPIVMLTGADAAESDTAAGWDAGANDRIAKPFRLGALTARLRVHIRRHERSDDAVFAVGPYIFKPGARRLIDRATRRTIRLTDKETAILQRLHRANGKAIGREALLDEVWGYNAGVTTHTLETHVHRLRRKIEPNPGRARILVTEAGGYRLVF